MRNLSMLALVLTSLATLPAVADETKIDIASPADGSRFAINVPVKLVYAITSAGEGDHVHLYADDKQVALLRQLKGSHTLEPLMPGVHRICVKIVNRNHTPTGAERCIEIAIGQP